MKKGRNNNTISPHLLVFWIKQYYKEGNIIKPRKKNTSNENKSDNDSDN